MRNRFDQELEELGCELVQMGAMIEHAIAGAAKALSGRDAEKAREIMRLDERIDEQERAAIRMVTASVDAFVRKDRALVRAVVAADDVVDGLFCEVRDALVRFIAAHGDCGEQAIDGLMIAKYLERIGDHAANTAEWVAFSITGDHRAAYAAEG